MRNVLVYRLSDDFKVAEIAIADIREVSYAKGYGDPLDLSSSSEESAVVKKLSFQLFQLDF